MHVTQLDKLPDLLIAITEPKHTSVNRMHKYNGEQDENTWIASAIRAARERCKIIAESLEVKLGEIHSVSYKLIGTDNKPVPYGLPTRGSIDETVRQLTMDEAAIETVHNILNTSLVHKRCVSAEAKVSYELEIKDEKHG